METNTTETTSIRSLATAFIEASEKNSKAAAAYNNSIAALNLIPKTKTGRDTKAVKEAKEKAANLGTLAYNEKVKAYNALQSKFKEVADEYNAFASFPSDVIETLRWSLGYEHQPELADELRATTEKIDTYNANGEVNGRDSVKLRTFYLSKKDFVFTSPDKTTDVIISARHSGTRIRYIGDGPVVAEGFGKYLDYESNCVTSFLGFENGKGSINISSVGTETFNEAQLRLTRLLAGIHIQKTIDSKHLAFQTDYAIFDPSLAEFIVQNKDSVFGFRKNEEGKIEPFAGVPNERDTSVVYAVKVD